MENYGFVGLFIICFISSSLYPLSSEAFVAGFIALGFDTFATLLIATFGNTLGSLSTYVIGYFGDKILLKKYFANAYNKIHKYNTFVRKYGFIGAIFSFLPIIGDILVLALGVNKYPFYKALIFITLGKFMRYLVLIYGISKFLES